MPQTIKNPVIWSQIESDITPAEKRFADCMARGVLCILGEAVPEREAPGNKVRAEVIRFFAFGGDVQHPILGADICLYGAWVVGQLNLNHARIPFALDIRHCYFAETVLMQNAKCTSLFMSRTRLVKGLKASGLQTGNVFLRDQFSSEGQVRLFNASIEGDLDCSRGNLSNPDGPALAADGMKVGRNVFFRDGFSSKGEVQLPGARIGGDLDFSGSRLSGTSGNAVNIQRTEIKQTLFWRDMECCGTADFRFAEAGILVDKVDDVYQAKSPNPPFKMHLDGFAYGRLFKPGNVQSRLRWLANQPVGEAFSPLPYEQAANVLFAMGHDDDAREIPLRKERKQTKFASFSARKIARQLWNLFAGYGYRLRKTLLWSGGIVLVGMLVFYGAERAGHIVPHQPVVLVNKEYLKCCDSGERPTEAVERLFPDYPHFNALVFSADVFIPFFALHQESYWYPWPKGAVSGFWSYALLGWYWLEIIAGWALTSLLLLSITGLLRPRQHTGKD